MATAQPGLLGGWLVIWHTCLTRQRPGLPSSAPSLALAGTSETAEEEDESPLCRRTAAHLPECLLTLALALGLLFMDLWALTSEVLHGTCLGIPRSPAPVREGLRAVTLSAALGMWAVAVRAGGHTSGATGFGAGCLWG